MTADDFRNVALQFPDVVESSHMNHPDFRIGGKIFASLGYPDEGWGMVKLTPEQQKSFVRDSPRTFRPCKGAWGARGATNVHLASAIKAEARAALDAAFRNVSRDFNRTPTRVSKLRPSMSAARKRSSNRLQK